MKNNKFNNKEEEVILKHILRGKNGDKESKKILIEIFTPYLRRKSIDIFIRGLDSEDIISIGIQAILKAINKFDLSRGGLCEFISYVNKSIYNSLKEEMRRASLREDFFIEELTVISAEEEVLCDFEKREIENLEEKLKLAINNLGEKDREVIKNYYFSGKTLKQQAIETGENYEALVKRKNRALKKMRKYMEKK